MNEYFTSLRAIAQSSTELLAGQYHSLDSLEIKHSATTLRSSIQPCLDELLQAQIQFGRNLIGCMKALDQSEAVWHSKQQIIAVSDAVTLEKVGEISGCWNRLQQFAAEEKAKIIEQANQNWLSQIEELKKKFFFDSKSQKREVIGWGEKDGFTRELPGKISSVSESLDKAVRETLDQLFQRLDIKHFDSAQTFTDLLDPELKSSITQEKESLLAELEDKFYRKLGTLSNSHTLDLSHDTNSKVKEWQSRFGNISWDEVDKFRDKGFAKIEGRVELVINDRLAILQKVVKWTLTFYNHFLSLQKRYQQEAPEQRAAEKAWLDQQRQQLQQLLDSVEINLKEFTLSLAAS